MHSGQFDFTGPHRNQPDREQLKDPDWANAMLEKDAA